MVESFSSLKLGMFTGRPKRSLPDLTEVMSGTARRTGEIVTTPGATAR